MDLNSVVLPIGCSSELYTKIKAEVFQNNLSEELAKIIFSSTQSSDLQLDAKKWEMDPSILMYKVELVRFNIFINHLLNQIANLENTEETRYLDKQIRYICNTLGLNFRQLNESLLKLRHELIKLLSLLPTAQIRKIDLNCGVALPSHFASPNLLDVACHFSWVRKSSGDNLRKNVSWVIENRLNVMGNSLAKVCELGGSDWKLISEIVADEKTRDGGLYATVRYFMSKQNRQKAVEVSELILGQQAKELAAHYIGS